MSTTVPGFLTKTFEIFSAPEYSDCCGWGPHGDTIIVRKIEQFSRIVLPKYFKHANFQSFVRQLNMYDFHKTVQDPTHAEFQHQYFLQNKPELLVQIKRKVNNRAAETQRKLVSKSLSEQGTASSSSAGLLTFQNGSAPGLDDHFFPDEIAHEAQALMKELEQQKAMRADFENRIEARLSELEGENNALKTLFLDAHQKTLIMQERLEKIFKTMYSLFVHTQNKRLMGGRPMNMLLPDLQGNYLAGQTPRAILDVPADIGVAQPLGDGSLDRLPSIDFNVEAFPAPLSLSASGSAAAPYQSNSLLSSTQMSQVDGASLLENRLAGAELSKVTSFDFAAASVVPPPPMLNRFKSFDALLLDPTPLSLSPSLSPSVSGRVVELPANESLCASPAVRAAADEALPVPAEMPYLPQASSLKRSASSVDASANKELDEESPEKRLRFSDEQHESVDHGVSQSVPFTSSTQTAMPTDTANFIDLLNRNQNTTLNRLDSLEMTLNSLWDTFDDEGNMAKSF